MRTLWLLVVAACWPAAQSFAPSVPSTHSLKFSACGALSQSLSPLLRQSVNPLRRCRCRSSLISLQAQDLGVLAHLAEASPDLSSVTREALVGGMMAGAVAGTAVDLALYPIDTVKTRMQTKQEVALNPSELYSGLLGSLAGHVPSSAVFFAAYQTSKVLGLEPVFGVGSVASQLLASAIGNLAASTIRVPTEVVKTRLQSGADQDLAGSIQGILARDGPAGLFLGYNAFLLRDLPFDAIEFVTYEQLRIFYAAMLATGGQLADWENALIGAIAGGVTGALTTPLDTVRARTMNEAGENVKTSNEGVVATTLMIAKEEGLGALFSGVQPRVLWLSLGGTIFFSSLEASKKIFLQN